MAIYYVDPLSGSDVAAGTSFALAWATTQKAADTAVAGDEVRLCNTATESVATQIDFDTNSGSTLLRIKFKGFNATGTAEEYGYKLQATAAITSVLSFPGGLVDSIGFYNLIVDGNSNATYCYNDLVDGTTLILFYNSRFTNAVSHNVRNRGSMLLYNVETDNAGGNGLAHTSTNRGSYYIVGGSSHHNVGYGWNVNQSVCTVIGMAFYKNLHGLNLDNNSSNTNVQSCLFDSNTNNNGGYGYDFNQSNTEVVFFFNHNLFYNNTSGDSDQTIPGYDNITGSDPLYTSIAAGIEDYTPLAGSPLIGAGVNGSMIGALAPLPGGGGGETSHVFAS
jgi:hypothetical protein